MKAARWRVGGFLVAAWVLIVGLAAAVAPGTASADDCEVVCYKHPVTGEIICTPPCP
jgi:hypothetical protein